MLRARVPCRLLPLQEPGCLAVRTSSGRRVVCSSSSSNTPQTAATSALLHWATSESLQQPLSVTVTEHREHARSLVAVTDIAPGEIILSVNADKVFSSQAENDLSMHWAAEMAFRILQERYACSSNSSGSGSGSSSNNSISSNSRGTSSWQPWIASLPTRVVTPVVFTSEEVQQLVIPSAVQAVLNMRTCLEDCYNELSDELQTIGCGWEDFLWAVQVLHSRCFFEPSSGRHLAVPGVDMANHSSTVPTATVRIIHNPGACQGLDALEEVAPLPESMQGPTSYFQLVAGADGIKAGQEVTIRYGTWPAEPFLLLFGFVPQPNPHDSITLFSNLQHMAECYLQCLASQVKQLSLLEQATDSANAGSRQLQVADGQQATQPTAAAVMHKAQQLVQDQEFGRVFHREVLAAEHQQQQLSEHAVDGGADVGPFKGPGGFVDLIINLQGIDGRLPAALSIIYRAVSIAVQQCCGDQQTSMPADPVAAAGPSEGSSNRCVSSGNSSDSSSTFSTEEADNHPPAVPNTLAQKAAMSSSNSIPDEVTSVLQLPLTCVIANRLRHLQSQLADRGAQGDSACSNQGSPAKAASAANNAFFDSQHRYSPDAEHAKLISSYRSSKGALVQQLLAKHFST